MGKMRNKENMSHATLKDGKHVVGMARNISNLKG